MTTDTSSFHTSVDFSPEARHLRRVERIVAGIATSDGAGVKLVRLLTPDLQTRLDPFLMLDAFGTDRPEDYIAGFPNHPHRGFETVTLMIEGRMRHRDSQGNEGLLRNGGVQWMTAGRGLIHSELPEQEEGRMEGFQLWLNLAAQDKMIEPGYRDLQSDDIPEFKTAQGVRVRVIAGVSHGIEGAVQRPHTDPLYLDLHFSGPSNFIQPLPADRNVFVVPYRGDLSVGGTDVPVRHLAILENRPEANCIELRTERPARALLIAGKPLKEPIVQYGPFVMNSPEEIRAAVQDYQAGRFAG